MIAAAPVWSAGNQVADVRVLIDISGSMKKSDPDNLRIPATRLIAGLMPEGSRSGVWTFGRYINMLVPVRIVDDEWRELAKEKSALINSAGLYTNIEGVLENASSGWFEYDPNTKRNIILLSDGYVDVSKKISESEASRRRIIEKTLPRLKKAGVIVHTVALSEDADHQLLETISIATGGSYMKATKASKLNRIFLKLFEKSAEVPSLPLKNNKFKVDKSINNMTLVIMQEGEVKEVAVIAPDGKSFNQASHPGNVKWHHEKGFDLVTVESPVVGQWKIDANIDPDNRVIVATNLELDVSPIPNSIMPGETVHISGHLLEDGKPLTERELLNTIDMVLLQEQPNGTAQSVKLSDNGIPPDLGVGDGVFSTTMRPLGVQGVYELSVIATAPTFEREYRHTINVMGEPIATNVEQLSAEQGGIFLLTLTPRIDKSVLIIESLTLKLAGSDQPAVELPRDDKDVWNFELPSQVGDKHLTFNAYGKIDGGREFFYEWNIAMPSAPVLGAPSVEVIAHEPEVIIADEPAVAANDHHDEPTPETDGHVIDEHVVEGTVEHDEEVAEEKSDGTNWVLVIGIIVGVNLLLAIGGGVWWWLARKRGKTSETDEFEVGGSEADDAEAGTGSNAGVNAEVQPKTEKSPAASQDAVIAEVEESKDAETEAEPVEEAAGESAAAESEADKVA